MPTYAWVDGQHTRCCTCCPECRDELRGRCRECPDTVRIAGGLELCVECARPRA